MTAVRPEEIEHLVLVATRAPSVHNTQPWRLRTNPNGLLLLRDRTRQLDVIDPEGRELLLSCGALLHHLEVAARAMGIDATVTLDVHGDIVATIALTRGLDASGQEVAAAEAILHRHTHRGRFGPAPLTASELELLHVAVEAQLGLLRVVHDHELVEVEVLVSRAERWLHEVDGYERELARWVWHDLADPERADGLPQAAVDHGTGRAESLEGRDFTGDPKVPVEAPAAEHPVVVLLSTLHDSPEDWVQAGRALSALLLTATELGLVAQPLAQVIDLPAARHAVSRLLSTVGSPQMLLRLGHGTSQAVAPRRAVADVLSR